MRRRNFGERNNSGGGIGTGFVGLLTIVFITLKLLGKITWSWLWVLAPIWIQLIIIILVFIIAYIAEGRR